MFNTDNITENFIYVNSSKPEFAGEIVFNDTHIKNSNRYIIKIVQRGITSDDPDVPAIRSDHEEEIPESFKYTDISSQ